MIFCTLRRAGADGDLLGVFFFFFELFANTFTDANYLQVWIPFSLLFGSVGKVRSICFRESLTLEVFFECSGSSPRSPSDGAFHHLD